MYHELFMQLKDLKSFMEIDIFLKMIKNIFLQMLIYFFQYKQFIEINLKQVV